MGLSAVLNEIPRPIWIAAMVIGFIWYWPIGLALLAYTLGSGRCDRRWARPLGPLVQPAVGGRG